MTSANRDELVRRAVEGGLLDDIIAEAEARPSSQYPAPHDGMRETILTIREKLKELLGERPRQTKRLMRVAVEAIWRRRGDLLIPSGDLNWSDRSMVESAKDVKYNFRAFMVRTM